MRGLNVNGFIVVETLGSGRAGILYLARHPTTGQEAVIRVASTAENELTAKVFLEEAASLLPAAKDVKPSVASDGSRVLMAVAAGLAAAERAPGSGWSERAEPQRTPQPVQTRLGLVFLLVGLAALAAAVTLVVLTVRQQPVAAPAIAVAPALEPDAGIVAKAEAPVAVVAPPSTPAPVAVVVPPPESAVIAKAERPPPSATRPASCATAQWKKRMKSRLDDLEENGTAIDRTELLRALIALDNAVASATTDCAQVVADIDALTDRAIVKKTCIADDRWRATVRAEMGRVKIAVSHIEDDKHFAAFEDAEDVIAAKLNALPLGADCLPFDAEFARFKKKWAP